MFCCLFMWKEHETSFYPNPYEMQQHRKRAARQRFRVPKLLPLPGSDLAVPADSDSTPVGCKPRPHDSDLAAEFEDLLAAGHVPKLDRVVEAPSDQSGAIGAESHGADVARVAEQGDEFLAIGSVGQACGLVPARRGQPRPVGAKGDGDRGKAVSGEVEQQLARCRLPDLPETRLDEPNCRDRNGLSRRPPV